MILDFQSSVEVGGVITFPDFPYADLPKPPSQIKETVIIMGSSTGGSRSIGATVDTDENN